MCEFTKNINNVRIKVCCASCCNYTYPKSSVEAKDRFCRLGHIVAGAHDYCDEHSLKNSIDRIKVNPSKNVDCVKSGAYFHWLAERREKETEANFIAIKEAEKEGRKITIRDIPLIPTKDLREIYTRKVGSCYLTEDEINQLAKQCVINEHVHNTNIHSRL